MSDIIENELKIPRHLAVILDGNGRWAKAKGLPRNMGHVEGAKTVEKMCEIAWNKGIEYFTVYAFSTENWSRPKEEVSLLMKLLRDYMVNCVKRSMKNNMKVRVIGDKSKLDEDIQASIANLEEKTKDNTGLKFTIAINYGSRDEIRRAVRSIAEDVKDGKVSPDDVDEALIESHLDTAGYPDPDLLIRTSGEQRISNYLLWQIAYSEFYFAECNWPDFNESELDNAILEYNKRERRFGKV
ncbi:MAG: isoprenyl transferase [Lachnospiraceae bacterium]|nr:isoprenyl transferase [Lachnospiraceae bacterium]